MPTTPPSGASFGDRRRAEIRRGLKRAVIWTVVALVVVIGIVLLVTPDATPMAHAITALVIAAVVLALAAAVVWQAAGKRASSTMIREWAMANGWAYWGRDMPAEPTPEPFESRYDDYMLATEAFPEATPLLRKGDRRYVTDVLAGTVDGLAVRIANHTYETDSYDADGNRTTSYTNHVVALVPHAPRVTPLRLVRRSRLGKALKGADDKIAGMGSMKAVDMENRDFNRAFSLRVADDADMVLVFELFDQVTQERLADGRDVPAVDLVEAEGPWLMIADGGTVRGDQLSRIEQMIAAIRWARTTLD